MNTNHFQACRILGFVSGDVVNRKEIAIRYRQQSKKCHPDLFPGDESKNRSFLRLGEARTTLMQLVEAQGSVRMPGDAGVSRDNFNPFDLFRDAVNRATAKSEPRWSEGSQTGHRSERDRGNLNHVSEYPAIGMVFAGYPYSKSSLGAKFHVKVREGDLFGAGNKRCPACLGYGAVKSQGYEVSCEACHGTGTSGRKTAAIGGVVHTISFEIQATLNNTPLLQILQPVGMGASGYGVVLFPTFPKGVYMIGNDLHIRKTFGKSKKTTINLWSGKRVRVSVPEQKGLEDKVIRIPGKSLNGGDVYIHFSPVT